MTPSHTTSNSEQEDNAMTTKAVPDYVYNQDDWEATYEWSDRGELEDELRIHLGQYAKVSTLIKGPAKYFAHKVTAWDADGEPEEYEIEWFDTKEQALAAVAAQRKPTP